MDFSSHGGELASLEVPDRPPRFTSEQGVKVEWPEYKIGEERIEYCIAGKPKQDLVLPFFTVWRTTDVPAAKIRCTLGTSAGEATVRTAGRAAGPLAADRRRSRRTQSRRTRRSGRRRPRLTQASSVVCGATSSSGPSAMPLPTLFSGGLAGALDIRPRVERAAHRHRVLDAQLRVAARPPRPRGWAGSPASGRGPARPPRSGSSSPACRCRGSRLHSRAPPGRSHSLRVQRPAKAKGSPPST